MAINIEKLKEKIEEEAKEAYAGKANADTSEYREYLTGFGNGLYRAYDILQEAINKEEQEQKKQQEVLDTIKEVLSGFCPKL